MVLLLITACRKENTPSIIHSTPPPPPNTPVITSFKPASGNVNTLVTIMGANFNTIAAGDTVKFNGAPAAVQSATDSTLTVLAPSAGTNGAITVITGKGKATGPAFIYEPDVYIVGTVFNHTFLPYYGKTERCFI